jgi:uncharacterized YccA/Bax inhibitor family protein
MTVASSGNPAFSKDLFPGYEQVYGRAPSTTMTIQGTVNKSLVLVAILGATAAWSWHQSAAGSMGYGILAMSALGGLIVAMITIFKPTVAPWTAPIYAALEGVFLGAISQVIELRYGGETGRFGGIALQAVSLTGGVLCIMLFLYATRIIRVTHQLAMAITAATGAVCFFYLITIVLRMFGVSVPFVFGSSPIGIGFSLFVVGLAAFNLLLDFDFIESMSQRDAPKYMEWYGAFGLMVTLVWLYLEILRLLAKLADRR